MFCPIVLAAFTCLCNSKGDVTIMLFIRCYGHRESSFPISICQEYFYAYLSKQRG